MHIRWVVNIHSPTLLFLASIGPRIISLIHLPERAWISFHLVNSSYASKPCLRSEGHNAKRIPVQTIAKLFGLLVVNEKPQEGSINRTTVNMILLCSHHIWILWGRCWATLSVWANLKIPDACDCFDLPIQWFSSRPPNIRRSHVDIWNLVMHF